jgi:hypothetical protein
VIGGPDYTLPLKVSSADIEYRIALTLLDFGDRFSGDRLSGSITLQNISDVPSAYRLNVPKHCTFLDVSIDSTNRTLSTGQQQQFEIQIIPGLPRKYKERFSSRLVNFPRQKLESESTVVSRN